MTGTAAPFEPPSTTAPEITTAVSTDAATSTTPDVTTTSTTSTTSTTGTTTGVAVTETTAPAVSVTSTTLRAPTNSAATTAAVTSIATTVAATTPTQPPTTVTTAPPRTIGACQAVGLDVANGWREELGRAPLAWSSTLYAGACAWATHLAELGGGGSHQAGPYGEVVYWSSNGCGGMWSSWRNSSGHYNGITGELLTTGAFATVTDSNGRCWAVGRMAL